MRYFSDNVCCQVLGYFISVLLHAIAHNLLTPLEKVHIFIPDIFIYQKRMNQLIWLRVRIFHLSLIEINSVENLKTQER
jgi:hypothetical protein